MKANETGATLCKKYGTKKEIGVTAADIMVFLKSMNERFHAISK